MILFEYKKGSNDKCKIEVLLGETKIWEFRKRVKVVVRHIVKEDISYHPTVKYGLVRLKIN